MFFGSNCLFVYMKKQEGNCRKTTVWLFIIISYGQLVYIHISCFCSYYLNESTRFPTALTTGSSCTALLALDPRFFNQVRSCSVTKLELRLGRMLLDIVPLLLLVDPFRPTVCDVVILFVGDVLVDPLLPAYRSSASIRLYSFADLPIVRTSG